jgi:hypothetical protein
MPGYTVGIVGDSKYSLTLWFGVNARNSGMTSSLPSTAAWSLDAEAASLGRAYAAANLRLDLRAPTAFIDAFMAYRGPKGRVDDYFAKKLLGLRLMRLSEDLSLMKR